jgi:bleomycin hydrolase
MKKIFLSVITVLSVAVLSAQTPLEIADPKLKKENEKATQEKAKAKAAEDSKNDTSFTVLKNITATPVKNQGMTNTCWCFAGTSLLESQCLKQNLGEFDLSEIFTVRNTYIEKAKNYIMRQGHTQFGEGGMGHDVINMYAKYGAMPETAYTGLIEGYTQHNHVSLVRKLKTYLDSLIKVAPVPEDWQEEFNEIMNEELGAPPSKFNYNGKEYTPKSFAANVLKFNADDYVYLTSFTHHPYYAPFIIEVPDNFSNGAYYNLPLAEMIQVTKDAVNSGYSVLWDADISNTGFQQKMGAAVNFNSLPDELKKKGDLFTGEAKEGKWDAATRQKLFENLTTQDDHMMHIIGLEKAKSGNIFFRVKNSWGDVGPRHGYINVSEGYFAINTISLVIPKAAINKKLLEKLQIK